MTQIPIKKIDTLNVRATPAQLEYIEQLGIDLTLSRKQIIAHINSILEKEPGHIKYLDELTKQEAIFVIGKFKEWKDSK